jgi:flagellar M-ring protein FliF
LRIQAPAAPLLPAPPKPLFVIPDFLLKVLPAPLKDPAALLAAVIAVGVLILILGLAVFWFLRKRKKGKVAAQAAAVAAAVESANLSPEAIESLQEDDGRSFEERLAEQQSKQKRLEQNELARLKMPEVTTQKGKILQQHITDEAQKDPLMIAQILRSWLHGDREKER